MTIINKKEKATADSCETDARPRKKILEACVVPNPETDIGRRLKIIIAGQIIIVKK